jgi:hypothetical protein
MNNLGIQKEGLIKMWERNFDQLYSGWNWGTTIVFPPDPEKANAQRLRVEHVSSSFLADAKTIVCKIYVAKGDVRQLLLTGDNLVDESDNITIRFKIGDKIEPGVDPDAGSIGKTDSVMDDDEKKK